MLDFKNKNTTPFRLFNTSNRSDMETLSAAILAAIAAKNKENEPFAEIFVKMTEWLKKYVNNEVFFNRYSDKNSLELVAEATYWSVKLGLAYHFAEMSYEEIRQFQPLKERFTEQTPRAKAIDAVCNQLEKPAMSYEASWALSEAALCIFVRNHSLEKLLTEREAFNAKQTLPKPRM